MKTLLLFLALTMSAFAGPPEGAQQMMIPYPSVCTPGMTEMMSALTKDYAVHISMTFEETPVTGVVVVHNPDTRSAAVLHISEGRTCLVFSGLNLLLFDRPEGMAPPEVDIENLKGDEET